MYSDAPANEDDDVAPNLWERVEIERGAFVTVPNQTRMEQLKAEHPNANYDEFVKSHLREIARCMSVPAVVALGDASAYNYASGRLDIQSFWRQVSVDRSVIESRCLDLLFAAWLDEALLVPGYLPAEFSSTAADWQPSWRWTDSENVNRAQEASGQETELRNNTTTLAREFGRRGLDWEVELQQRAREVAVLKKLGLSTTTEAPPAVPPALDPNLQDAAV
jgi:capsid protein